MADGEIFGWRSKSIRVDEWLFGSPATLELRVDLEGNVTVRDIGNLDFEEYATTPMPDTLEELVAWCRLVAGVVGRWCE